MNLITTRRNRQLVVPRPLRSVQCPALVAARLAARLSRWAILGVVRREPAQLLTLGFGAGLALAGLAPRPRPLTPTRQPDAIVSTTIETVVIQSVRVFRRG